jgi:Ketosteroid isomerase-related protein
VVAAGALVALEWSTTGTFLHPFRGHEPSGKSFRRRGCAVGEVEGGKIVRYRDYYDRATLLQQLASWTCCKLSPGKQLIHKFRQTYTLPAHCPPMISGGASRAERQPRDHR